MWLALDLPLLRNIYSVVFASCESRRCSPQGAVRGRGWREGSPGPRPTALPGSPAGTWELGWTIFGLKPAEKLPTARPSFPTAATVPGRRPSSGPGHVWSSSPGGEDVPAPGAPGWQPSRVCCQGLPVSSHALRGWAAWRLGESPALGGRAVSFHFLQPPPLGHFLSRGKGCQDHAAGPAPFPSPSRGPSP